MHLFYRLSNRKPYLTNMSTARRTSEKALARSNTYTSKKMKENKIKTFELLLFNDFVKCESHLRDSKFDSLFNILINYLLLIRINNLFPGITSCVLASQVARYAINYLEEHGEYFSTYSGNAWWYGFGVSQINTS